MAGGFEALVAKQPPNPSKTGVGGFEYLAAKKGPEEDSWIKNAGRKAYQLGAGALNMTKIPLALDAMSALATGESLSELEDLEDRLPELRKKFPHADLPEKIDREKYMQSLQEAQESFPTQRNIEKKLEEKTGLPLAPKTRADELFRLAGSAGKLSPGGAAQKTVAGVAAPVVSQGLVELGVPEPVADLVGLGSSNPLGKAFDAAPRMGKSTKPSGLTTRRYEGIKAPKKVGSSVIERINEKTEAEFRDISNKLIQEGEGAKTYNALKNDTGFKKRASEMFQEVERVASEIEEPVFTMGIKERLIKSKQGVAEKGFAASPYDKAYKKYINEMIKDIKAHEVMPKQLVQQFRKNNAALSEHYNPAASRAENRAQKDALLDFNRAIEATITEEFPGSEFSKVFEPTNKQWSQIKDAEYIDRFVDDMFDGKIRYDTGSKFLKKENAQLPFKRALGEEGFKKFEGLMNDLMSTEQANKMLKVADKMGVMDMAQYAVSYVLHPSLAGLKFAYGMGKTAFNNLLDKPQLGIKWKKGVDQFKQGSFVDSAKTFMTLEKDLRELPEEEQD